MSQPYAVNWVLVHNIFKVERLVDRVRSSTLLDDRRDACRALKALSRKFRIEVGAQGMDALCQVLEMDRRDCEIVGYALDTLCNIMSPESFEDEGECYKWIRETVRLWDTHYTCREVVQLQRDLKMVNVILYLKPVAFKIYMLSVSQKTYYFLITNTNHLNALVVSNCVFWELYLTCKCAGKKC